MNKIFEGCLSRQKVLQLMKYVVFIEGYILCFH